MSWDNPSKDSEPRWSDAGEYRPAFPKPTKAERAQPKPITSKSSDIATRLEDYADQLLYRLLLKRANGCCESVGYGFYENGDPVKCGGKLDPSHGFSRARHGVRWAAANVWIQCRRHHDYFTARPSQWFRWRVTQIGASLMEHVRRLANTTWRGDVNDVIAELREGRTQVERVA